MNSRQAIVRNEYEQVIAHHHYLSDGMAEFFPNARIGRLELVVTGEYCDYDFDTVEIERIEQPAPQSVSDTFERHVWFSQYCLTDVYAFKIPVSEQDTYAIAASGLVGDSWDNACTFIEVFDTSGEFLGAVEVRGETLLWRDRPFDGNDFPSPAPLWAERESVGSDRPPMWSEITATQIEQNGSLTRLIFYIDD